MYKLENIRNVHLEMTELCQAACPMCPRRKHTGEINPHLTMAELSLEDCKKIFPVDFVKNLKYLNMCGTFGDPAAAKDTLAVMHYLRDNNKWMWLEIHTNGGLRNKEWWIELAQIIGDRGAVVFSVDGLKDTNYIYRQNVVWENVEENMHTYIGAGGNAQWEFLVFDHNQHQVEVAKQLSIDWGFSKFITKKSARFSLRLEKNLQTHSVINPKGKQVSIHKPTEEFQNPAERQIDNVFKKYGTVENYYKTVPIACKAVKDNIIYITAEGLFLPCCWLHFPLYMPGEKDHRAHPLWRLIDQVGGKEKLDARNGLQSVFDSGILELIEKAWNAGEGRLKICAETCGVDFDPAGSEKQDILIIQKK